MDKIDKMDKAEKMDKADKMDKAEKMDKSVERVTAECAEEFAECAEIYLCKSF